MAKNLGGSGSRKRKGGKSRIEMEEKMMSLKNKLFMDMIESYRYTGVGGGSAKVGSPSSSTQSPSLPPTAPLSAADVRRPKLRVMAPCPSPDADADADADSWKKRKRSINSSSRKRNKEEAANKAKSDNRKGKGKGKGSMTMIAAKPKPKAEKPSKKPKPRSILTAAEKRCDAYLRVPEDHPWVPPQTGVDLIQLDYYRDPWKVLVICILLNRTTSMQVTKVLKEFLRLCPNAETAKDVCEEKLTLMLKSLGFKDSRTKKIKRFSCEYVERNWTYVTELHGIGKYAADAYAIVCAGKPEKVTPEDHKLVPYWESLLYRLGRQHPSQV